MTTNFRIYGKNLQPMMAQDLTVGQKLTHIVTPENSYGAMVGKFALETVTVVKILKTRLVLATENGRQVRLLIESSKWTIRQGEITGTIEGTSENWRREEYRLATQDDPIAQQMEDDYKERYQEQQDRRAAKEAVAKVRQTLDVNTTNLETIEEAIQALQVVADGLRAKR